MQTELTALTLYKLFQIWILDHGPHKITCMKMPRFAKHIANKLHQICNTVDTQLLYETTRTAEADKYVNAWKQADSDHK